MVMRERVERIELPVEQIAYVPGSTDPLRVARRLWAATQRTALVAAHERATSLASFTSSAPVVTGTSSTTFRRLVDVPGACLEPVLRTWWSRSSHDDGHLGFERLIEDRGLIELDGWLRTSAMSRRIPVAMVLSPYLGCWTFLELTPQRSAHPSRVYFRVGHDALDRFVAALCALV